MTSRRDRLLTDPLFYDALSGEFTPPSDSQRRHTLGRLAYAAFTKGEHVLDDALEPPLTASLYTPSWAGHVTARVYFDAEENGPRTPILSGISLRDKANEHSLYVASEGAGSKIFTATTNKDIELELSLGGDKLSRAQTMVTNAAQEFFDSATLL